MEMSSSGSCEPNSAETSVPTDLTVTSHGNSEGSSVLLNERDEEDFPNSKRDLQKLVEKLRMELKSKNSQLVAFQSHADNLVSKITLEKDSAISERQALISRLENDVQTKREELSMIKTRTARELANLVEKCVSFQDVQKRLKYQQEDVKATLEDLQISEFDYEELKKLPTDQLNLKEFTSLRLHEQIIPLQSKVQELTAVKSSLNSTVAVQQKELSNLSEIKTQQDQKIEQLTHKLLDLTKREKSVRDELRTEDFRLLNFDRIKRERDDYEQQNDDLRKRNSQLEISSTAFRTEKEALEIRLGETHSKLHRIEHEFYQYKNSNVECSKVLGLTKEDLNRTSSLLNAERLKYEDIHSKYMDTREQYVSISDQLNEMTMKYKNVDEQLKQMTQSEINLQEQLHKVSRKFDENNYDKETECFKLTKERDLLRIEVEEAKRALNAVNHNYQLKIEESISLQKTLNQTSSESQKNKLNHERQIATIQRELDDVKYQLNQYQSVEKEYKSTLLAAARVPNQNTDLPFILGDQKLSEDVVSLTRRVLNLEKENMQACSIIHELTSACEQLKESLVSYKTAVGCAGQPASELLERISQQQQQISSLETALESSSDARNVALSDLKKAKQKIEDLLVEFSRRNRLDKEIAALRTEINRMSSIVARETQRTQTLPKAIQVKKNIQL